MFSALKTRDDSAAMHAHPAMHRRVSKGALMECVDTSREPSIVASARYLRAMPRQTRRDINLEYVYIGQQDAQIETHSELRVAIGSNSDQ